MKRIVILFFIIWTFSKVFCQEPAEFFGIGHTFKDGQIVYLFGDKVKLRASPGKNAEVRDILPIGSELTIVDIAEATMLYRGMNHHWYKVMYDGEYSYVLGALLSLKRDRADYVDYYYALGHGAEFLELRIRAVKDGNISNEYLVEVKTPLCEIKVDNGKGLSGVDNVIFVDFYAESCGSNGGGEYVFYANDQLLRGVKIKELSDAGLFYVEEKVVFPNDTVGITNEVLYFRESFEVLDENSHWEVTKSEKRHLKWDGSKLSANTNK